MASDSETLSCGAGFGAIEALRDAGLRVRLDDAGEVLLGPRSALTEEVLAFAREHKQAMRPVLEVERGWALAGCEPTHVVALWRTVAWWCRLVPAEQSAPVTALLDAAEAAERAGDGAAFWFACQRIMRLCARLDGAAA